MDNDLKIFFGFLGIFSLLLVWVLVIGPWRRLRKVRRHYLDGSWQQRQPDELPGWEACAQAAVAGVDGSEQGYEYTRKVAFLTESVEVTRSRRAWLRSPVYHLPSRHPQVAACALFRQVTRTRSRIFFSRFRGPAQRSGGTGLQFWRGEMRPFPIRKPVQLYSWRGAFAGNYFKELADRQQTLGLPLTELARPLRVLRESPLLTQVLGNHARTIDQVRPEIVLHPGGWVLVAPLSLASPRLAEIDALAAELATVAADLVREMVGGSYADTPPPAEPAGQEGPL